MSTHANATGMTVTGAPGTGVITLNALATGALQTFVGAFGAVSTTVDVMFEQPLGTLVGVERNAVYNGGTPGTITRGTPETPGSLVSLTSAAVVRVCQPASMGNLLERQLDRAFTHVISTANQQAVTAGAANKITNIDNVIANPYSWWDNGVGATGKRFTPLRAGSYVFYAAAQLIQSSQCSVSVRKNNVDAMSGTNAAPPSGGYGIGTCTGVLSANGSTDYFEVWVFTGGAGTTLYEFNGLFQAFYLGP